MTASQADADWEQTGNVGVLLYETTDEALAVLAAAIERLQARGIHVGGLIQRLGDEQVSGRPARWVEDIATGQAIRLDAPRGQGARACTLDPDALARAGCVLRQAIETGADLIVVSRFGSVEAEGGGLRPEIAEAILSGAAVLIPAREGRLADVAAFLGTQPQVLRSVDGIADWVARTAAQAEVPG